MLKQYGKVLAYADDIAILIKGELKLDWAIKALRKWSKEYQIEVNEKKSGIIHCRIDGRTPKLNYK